MNHKVPDCENAASFSLNLLVSSSCMCLFQIDLASLIPLDLLYFIPQLNYNSLVRLPRLLKVGDLLHTVVQILS